MDEAVRPGDGHLGIESRVLGHVCGEVDPRITALQTRLQCLINAASCYLGFCIHNFQVWSKQVQRPAQGIAAKVHHCAAACFRQLANFIIAVADLDAEVCIDARDLADPAVLQPVHAGRESRVVAIVEGLDQPLAAPVGSGLHGLGLIQIHRKWLLAQHMLAGLKRANTPFSMQIDRQRIVNEIDLRAGDQCLIGRVDCLHAMFRGKGLRPVLVASGKAGNRDAGDDACRVADSLWCNAGRAQDSDL